MTMRRTIVEAVSLRRYLERADVAAGRYQGCPSSPATGFTLIEVLVVVSILALLTVAVPVVRTDLTAMRLRNAAQTLVAELRSFREEARRTGRCTSFVATQGGYGLAQGNGWKALSSGTRLALAPAVPPLGGPPRTEIEFFRDGSTTGGIVTLHIGLLAIHVSVDRFDGAVASDD